MAYNYAAVLNSEKQKEKDNYVVPSFDQIRSLLSSLSLASDVYYRDLYFNLGTAQIQEIATGTDVTTLPLSKQYAYYEQGLQLLIRGLNYNYYP